MVVYSSLPCSESNLPHILPISEPLLYPKISGLVDEFKSRGFTSFIVTNGTIPEKVQNLDPYPSQLYVTLAAPNEDMYKKVCRPMIKNGWNNIMETMDSIESLDCRTLVRLTAVKDININESMIENYIKIIEKANPNFFEIKGFHINNVI